MAALTYDFTAQQIVEEGRTGWEDINLTKDWISTENLPKLTDEQIVLFLQASSNVQENVRKKIKEHYAAKRHCPEIFDNKDFRRAEVEKQLNTFEFCILPERTDDGCAIAFIRLHDTNFKNCEQVPVLKAVDMTLDATLREYPPKGLIILIDMKGVSIMHLTRIRIGALKTFLEYVQEGLPVKLTQMHVLNTVYFIDKAMYIVKPFMKKEAVEMITFHPCNLDMELFYEKHLPKKCLPEDYGGDLPPVRTLHLKNIDKVKSLQKYFEAEELQRRGVSS